MTEQPLKHSRNISLSLFVETKRCTGSNELCIGILLLEIGNGHVLVDVVHISAAAIAVD